MIRKIGKKYVVVGENRTKTGALRTFGAYDTKAEAEKRLQQVEYFKHNHNMKLLSHLFSL